MKRTSKRCQVCGKNSGEREYCGFHAKPCDMPGCQNRVTQKVRYCPEHRYGELRYCKEPDCHYSVKTSGDYCGSHAYACVTEGCSGRTRAGGMCKTCRTVASERGTFVTDPRGKGPKSELSEMIHNYEQVQHEANERGAIARERLPKLRKELRILTGAQG